MKITSFIFLFLLINVFAKAQYTDTHFGIKAGLNISSLDVKDGVDFDSKAGVNIGALAHVHLTPHFAVQPEVVYSQQGGKDGNDKWKINYVNIPVLLQYMIDNGFRLQTGPQLGIKTSAKIKSGDLEVENHNVNTFDFSWAIGASYISAAGLGVDARYNIGISNVNDADFPEVRNRVFQAGLFYQFMSSMHKSHKK
jgi:hypothetical protein